MSRLLLFVLAVSISFFSIIFCMPPEYSSRGTRPFLINYSAIKSNIFLTKIAHKRFHFLDEATQNEINFIRRTDSNYLILKYKDLVALHKHYPEAKEVNLRESAFLHSSDPANLTIIFDNGWTFAFTKDERFEIFNQAPKLNYKLYYSFDSINFTPVDSIYSSTKFKADLPSSSRFIKINTIVDDTLEIDYSFVLPLTSNSGMPLILPIEKKVRSSNGIDSIFIRLQILNNIIPDSLKIYIDLDRDNRFISNNEIVTISNVVQDNHYTFSTLNQSYKGGYEFYVLAYYQGLNHRFPKEGYWTTHPNNRIKNPWYGFFVMDVGDSNWRKTYINELQKAINSGYNGIFIDDCWSAIASWGVDAIPPIGYSDKKWINDVSDFLWLVRRKFPNVQIFFNGLTNFQALTLLPAVDGAMTEGFATRTWRPSILSTPLWQNYCNIGLNCLHKYKKKWLATGVFPNQQHEVRLYTLGSYCLILDSLSYYGSATSYQNFAHYPEFDIPFGKPLESARDSIEELKKFDINNKPFYSREFDNVIVYVNPSGNDTITLLELQGKPIIEIDTNKTIDGGKLRTNISDELLRPNEAKIVLKSFANTSSILTSPIIRNPKCLIEQINEDSIRLTISVEVADSSSKHFFSNPDMPLFVVADLSSFYTYNDIILRNDGSAASPAFSQYRNSFIIPSGINFRNNFLRNISIPIIAYSTTGLFSVGYAEIEAINIDTTNLLDNFSFEFDFDENGIPDSWRPYEKGFALDTINAYHGSRCVTMENLTRDEVRGISSKININQTEVKPIKISGYSKADNVDGKMDKHYSIYVDFWYNDGQPLYGQTAQFSVGTHDWEYAETIVFPEKPLKQASVYCLFRYHTGRAWFDKIKIEEYNETSYINELSPNTSFVQIVENNLQNGKLQIISFDSGKFNIELFNLLGQQLGSKEVWLDKGINIFNIFESFQSVTNGIFILRVKNHINSANKLILLF